VLNATYSTQFAVQFHLMTPAEQQILATKIHVTGFVWAQATEGFVGINHLSVPASSVPWVFVRANPNATVATAVGSITPLTFAAT
jgi:hypothetical protein